MADPALGAGSGEDTVWHAGIKDEALLKEAKEHKTPADLVKAHVELKGRATNGADWRDGIDDKDKRKKADRFNSPVDTFNAWDELDHKMASTIRLPTDDADEAEVKAYRKKIGVPDAPDGYKLTRPDDLPEHLVPDEAGETREKAFMALAHKHNTTPAAAQAFLTYFYGETVAADSAMIAAEDAALAEAEAGLMKDWGADAKENDAISAATAKSVGGDDFANWLDTTVVNKIQLGNHPQFRKVFATIGRLLQITEGKHHMGLSEGAQKTAQDRIDEIHKLQSTDEEAYKKAQPELNTLYSQLHGNEPIGGVRKVG